MALHEKKSLQASRREDEDVIAEREAFHEWVETVDLARVKVLDETGIIRGLRILYGYAPRGERVYDRAPYGKGKRLNLLGWIGLDGKGCLASYVGNVNKEVFTCFVKKRLVPELKPGDIVLWDNASFHRGDELKKMIEKRGSTIKSLPRYSPD